MLSESHERKSRLFKRVACLHNLMASDVVNLKNSLFEFTRSPPIDLWMNFSDAAGQYVLAAYSSLNGTGTPDAEFSSRRRVLGSRDVRPIFTMPSILGFDST